MENMTKEWLEAHAACEDGKAWFSARTFKSSTEVLLALLEESRFEWANWAMTKLFTHRQAVLFACHAARLSLRYFEAKYPGDKRPRKAIQAAARWAKSPTEKNRPAWSAAWSAAESAAWTKILRHGIKLLQKGDE